MMMKNVEVEMPFFFFELGFILSFFLKREFVASTY